MNNEDNFAGNENTAQDEMRSEYDFSGGVRGKHHQSYRQGHTVKIHQSDGDVIEQHFSLEDGAMFIEADVREYFPNAEAVNKALRGLIALFPKDKPSPEREKVK